MKVLKKGLLVVIMTLVFNTMTYILDNYDLMIIYLLVCVLVESGLNE